MNAIENCDGRDFYLIQGEEEFTDMTLPGLLKHVIGVDPSCMYIMPDSLSGIDQLKSMSEQHMPKVILYEFDHTDPSNIDLLHQLRDPVNTLDTIPLILIMSASSEEIQEVKRTHRVRFAIQKPITSANLQQTIEAALLNK